jgi:hypothetical protein
MSQNYISNILYHFVARKIETEDEQYKTLYKILKDGWLSFSPHDHSIYPGQIKIDSFKDRKINEMFNPDCVCFADIPEIELQIHISKYSEFGIAFYKSFLIEKGANHVFYIEDNSSICKKDFSSLEKYKSTNRVDYYQEFCSKTIWYFFQRYLYCCKNSEVELQDTKEILNFLINLFSHFKVWNNNLEDNDPGNYYFEREWRATNNINFQLSDIVVVILPKNCEKQFKLDFPEYTGELKIAEDIEKGTWDNPLAVTKPQT